MVLVVIVLCCAVVAGWLLGGRLRNLAHVQLRSTWLVFAAVGLQLLLGGLATFATPGEILGPGLLAASQVALLAFITRNRYLPGLLLVLLGFGLNALVIIPNGGMPVDSDALAAVSGPDATIEEPGKHRLLEDGDALPWLADVIAIPLLRTVVSVGDLVLAAGVGVLVVGMMRRFPPAPGHRSRPRASSPLGARGRTTSGASPESR